jgi:hypothetical protein
MPTVCFPAAAGLLGGPGACCPHWCWRCLSRGLSQACVRRLYAAERIGRRETGEGAYYGPAGRGWRWSCWPCSRPGGAFGSSPAGDLSSARARAAYMLGASVLMVLGMETWLPVCAGAGRSRQRGLPVPSAARRNLESTRPGGRSARRRPRLPARTGVHAEERPGATARSSPPNCGRPCQPSPSGGGHSDLPIVATGRPRWPQPGRASRPDTALAQHGRGGVEPALVPFV